MLYHLEGTKKPTGSGAEIISGQSGANYLRDSRCALWVFCTTNTSGTLGVAFGVIVLLKPQEI